MNKILPKEITSYDLLKSFAVLVMIIDHVGLYFFPDQLWWRAIGRFSAPVWLFLIGYARTRDIPVKLWGGAVLLTLANVFVTATFFPLTILFGMILARRVLDPVVRYMFSGVEPALIALVVFAVLMLPFNMAFDYGLLCLLIPIYGYMRRRPEEFSHVPAWARHGFAALTCGVYIFIAVAYSGMSAAQLAVLIGGVCMIFAVLYRFKPAVFPAAGQAMPRPLKWLIQFGGRRTLEIYVGHLILFKIIAYALGLDGFGLFEWSWI